jgi:4-hydroxy-3-methylbut-2-enyl diphosphate reductase
VGALVVFSAHGVSPEVRDEAGLRSLDVIDATCPLVSKVHAEARRFEANGATIFLIGHAGHEEVEGTTGHAPGAIRLIERPEDVDKVTVQDPGNVAFLTQTTLSVDEAGGIARALREQFPSLRGPSSDDICYATQNRQDAVKAVAQNSDVVLVVGSTNSSNSRRLVEVVERQGTPAFLIDDEADIDPQWLRGRSTIGVTAGASAPESLVQRVVDAIAGLGSVEVEEVSTRTETIHFNLPKEVR